MDYQAAQTLDNLTFVRCMLLLRKVNHTRYSTKNFVNYCFKPAFDQYPAKTNFDQVDKSD